MPLLARRAAATSVERCKALENLEYARTGHVSAAGADAPARWVERRKFQVTATDGKLLDSWAGMHRLRPVGDHPREMNRSK